MKRKFSVLLSFLLLTSCAHVLSEEYVKGAVKEIGFHQILDNINTYINNTFILGGTIIETKNTKDGSEIEVIQNPIDKYGGIVDKDYSEGRFILMTSRHLDPLIYKRGRSITFAGKLTGIRKELIGEREYNYPTFEAKEIYIWKKEKFYPYYPGAFDPFYYNYYYYPYPYYWYEPTWYRPRYPWP